jgi:transposase
LSQRPHRCRMWAPKGKTPVLQYNFNWKSLSAVAGLTLLNFYFRLYPGSVKGEQAVDFLKALVRHIESQLLVVWDGLPAHRSRLVRDYVAGLDGWIRIEYLPPYAPELNPVEYIWAYWKQHELPNVCPKDYWVLDREARRTLRRMRRRPRLITAFWKQASLWPEK